MIRAFSSDAVVGAEGVGLEGVEEALGVLKAPVLAF